MAAGTLAHVRRGELEGWVLAALSSRSSLYEQLAGALPFSGSDPVVVDAHLYGVLGGAAAARVPAARGASRYNPRRICLTASRMAFAFVFPGPGFAVGRHAAALPPAMPVVRATFDEASGCSVTTCGSSCRQGPEERAQRHREARSRRCSPPGWRPGGCGAARAAQHPRASPATASGEFTALVCAGALEFAPAVELVRFRGQVMQEAVPAGTGAMAAILGLEDAAVAAACREAAQGAASSSRSTSTRPARW